MRCNFFLHCTLYFHFKLYHTIFRIPEFSHSPIKCKYKKHNWSINIKIFTGESIISYLRTYINVLKEYLFFSFFITLKICIIKKVNKLHKSLLLKFWELKTNWWLIWIMNIKNYPQRKISFPKKRLWIIFNVYLIYNLLTINWKQN